MKKESKFTNDEKIELLWEAVLRLIQDNENREKSECVEVDVELNTRRLEILLWLTLLFNIGTGVLVVLFHLWIL